MEIYDRLLQFPLFQGMSHAELMQVVAHTKIGFSKSTAGKRIVREGDNCTHLYFLIGGAMKLVFRLIAARLRKGGEAA